MTARDVMNHVASEPFQPLRIRLATGRTTEIKHPEAVAVGRSTLALSPLWVDDLPEAKGPWYSLPLTLIESIEPMDAPGRQRGNTWRCRIIPPSEATLKGRTPSSWRRSLRPRNPFLMESSP